MNVVDASNSDGTYTCENIAYLARSNASTVVESTFLDTPKVGSLDCASTRIPVVAGECVECIYEPVVVKFTVGNTSMV